MGQGFWLLPVVMQPFHGRGRRREEPLRTLSNLVPFQIPRLHQGSRRTRVWTVREGAVEQVGQGLHPATGTPRTRRTQRPPTSSLARTPCTPMPAKPLSTPQILLTLCRRHIGGFLCG